ncbi:DUF4199 domain-containing protein [Emticicia sp. BO119]|uniref:DUF4199 domain-containing protein n=1 Tax=Emticicia sp. BO119 TaxID=2757768 RepID=UPI0015F08831|nr:DUF4199 domain-containing protein [Emticicia sp. BO119]MBA4848820.1 DUF4199 domain-containing protein [Emticicia sp. BO119]
MQKIVLTFGLIAGLIVSTFMVCSIGYCYSSGNFDGNIVVGYAAMLLAFSLVFVGVKNYRDKYNNGSISFGKAFRIGLYISLIASTIYVLVWLVDYYMFVPDFMEKYTTHVIQDAKENGASTAEIKEQIKMMEESAKLYETPIGVILLTYMEILPIGLAVTLISALILKRKHTAMA